MLSDSDPGISTVSNTGLLKKLTTKKEKIQTVIFHADTQTRSVEWSIPTWRAT